MFATLTRHTLYRNKSFIKPHVTKLRIIKQCQNCNGQQSLVCFDKPNFVSRTGISIFKSKSIFVFRLDIFDFFPKYLLNVNSFSKYKT